MSPLSPCPTPDALHAWVRYWLGLDVPRVSVCADHDAPFEYLRQSYFEPAGDLVVWAPRGGGKTRLAAVATLLDLLHKPGTAVRVLGGSLEQSMKLWEYLLPDLRRLGGRLLTGAVRDSTRRVNLANGSSAAVLTQSERAVRGLRVQKLRCDEVELFDPGVWEAAQLTTRSGPRAAAAVEACSTFHAPGGMMERVVEAAKSRGVPVVRWCLMDVIGRCEPERACATCVLLGECGGRAKAANGYLGVRDAIVMKGRVSAETWEAEMLCRRPTTRGRVFPRFDPDRHVRPFGGSGGEVVIGVDFGFAAPFVALWVHVVGDRLHVVDEYLQPGRTLPEHVAELRARPHAARRIYCDPAGAAVNGHSGQSDVAVLRGAGFVVRHRPSRIAEGVELVRRLLCPADGSAARLLVDPRCVRLIAAMKAYRYPPNGGGRGELPVKDGLHDHPVDALRYVLVNLLRPTGARMSRY